MKAIALVLVLGLAAGMAGGYYGRPSLEAQLGGDAGEEVEAVVVAERQEEDRLVLTLRAGDETFLATFRERAEDVAELVAPGDHITVRVASEGVFADDVPIIHVRRGEGRAHSDEPAADETAGEDAVAAPEGEAAEPGTEPASGDVVPAAIPSAAPVVIPSAPAGAPPAAPEAS